MTTDIFKRWDTITGWIIFAIALLTYALTVEPTVSFWDCGEYISTSARLEVGHPPGAPLFQMLGAFFAMFAPSTEYVALMVNCMSVLSSAFTILFLFWIITNLAGKMAASEGEISRPATIAILGSGAVGALAYTFSDSFWFNAVEAEVYAMASLLMSLLLWLGIKWVDELHSPRGNRWLVLIALVTGLTFGVQFMGFLAIPTIGLLYYFKNYKTVTVKNFLLANIAVVVILLLIYKFSLTYVLNFFGWSEIFFVNTIGLPFNSGTIIMVTIFILIFYFALRYTRKHRLYLANTITLCFMFMFIGFSSWLMLPIRANAHTPINENDPADARALLAYYNREQYPGVDSPVYGAMYSDMFAGQDEAEPYKDDTPKYEQDKKTGKYVVVNHYENSIPNSNSKHVGLLPRMWSSEHAANYMRFTRPLDFRIKSEYISNTDLKNAINQFRTDYANGRIDEDGYVNFLQQFGQYINVDPPALSDNIGFMFRYQFGYMYWRYFMWNFVGRQDDIQGKMDNHGNWLSGIKFIDEWHLGPQDNLPSDELNNKGRNTYFFLPMILGIIGLIFQIRRNPKQFWALFVFFMFTGIAIQFYTNVRPFEPRERDYSLVGSFYIFAIWIGIGVFALYEEFKKRLSPKILAPAVTAACLLAVPAVMAYQNWDDHDRSGRYTAEAIARNYLNSIQEDAGSIIFSIGDNDTFGLWYIQEIEGHRTDVRVINSSLFATDWYIDQMKRKAYESEPIPSQLTHAQYAYGVRDAIYYQNLTDERWDIKRFMDWVANDDNTIGNLIKRQGGDVRQYPENTKSTIFYPTNKIRIPVNKENVLKSGLVKEKDSALIVDYIDIDLPKNAIGKNRMMMLDILANNDWKRPIYFTGGSFAAAEYIWMKDYLQLDGMVYKLVPIKTPGEQGNFEMGRIDSDLMYNIVQKWAWGNSGSPDIYHDPETRKNSISYRSNMARLTDTLLKEGEKEKAREIIDLTMEKFPFEYYGYYVFLEPYVNGYYKTGQTEKARELFLKIAGKYQENLSYYLSSRSAFTSQESIIYDIQRYRSVLDVVVENDEESFGKKQTDTFNSYLDRLEQSYNGPASDSIEIMEEPPVKQPIEQPMEEQPVE
ncbi:glycosyltransferase family 117 protein [Sinomicrobium sp. M5D2P17]